MLIFGSLVSVTAPYLFKIISELINCVTYRNHNLAVNKLTLREKALNSDYIFTTELGSLKSKTERSSVYHLGGFANHKNFFIGYTAFNVESTNISDNENITLLKHCLVGGIHSPEYKKVKASALLRYEQELFKSYIIYIFELSS